MKYYIIAGEASGDLHASNLMKELKKKDPSVEFRCWGGDLMEEQGGEIVKHYRDLAFMGFIEVALNIRTVIGNIKFCKQDLAEYKPDALILVDYPGFNLRIAEFAHKKGLKVFYYISPQIWAWKKSRVHKIKKFVDRMFVILPFEKEFYAKYDYDVNFVGHPLLDMIESLPPMNQTVFREKNHLSEKPIVAILPGSRKQEVKKMLPIMLTVVKHFPDYQFVIAGAPSLDREIYENIIGQTDVKLIEGQTHILLQNAYAAMVTSGTATLETALFKVPEVVCYKGSFISYQIAIKVVDPKLIKFISLVNILLEKEAVKELIQKNLTVENLMHEFSRILTDNEYRSQIANDYELLKQKLGGPGASKMVAEKIYQLIK